VHCAPYVLKKVSLYIGAIYRPFIAIYSAILFIYINLYKLRYTGYTVGDKGNKYNPLGSVCPCGEGRTVTAHSTHIN
jgi:hypothetical protein